MQNKINLGLVLSLDLEAVQKLLDFAEKDLQAKIIFAKKSVGRLWIKEELPLATGEEFIQ
jgi:hypothetical protein